MNVNWQLVSKKNKKLTLSKPADRIKHLRTQCNVNNNTIMIVLKLMRQNGEK